MTPDGVENALIFVCAVIFLAFVAGLHGFH